MTDLSTLRTLLHQYAEVSKRLSQHPWIRNNNAPLGDVAENLVAEALGGTVADNNAKGYDVELPDGQLIQVKGITYRGKDNLVTSAIRSLDFDSVAIVICEPDFSVCEGLLVPKAKVVGVSRFHKKLNGYQIKVKQARPVALDITDKLRAVWN
jgi:hypothetical protein